MKLKYLLLIPLLLLAGCGGKNRVDDKTIVVGCSPTPHAEILKFVKPHIEKEGYKLDIRVINDYVTPNTLLNSGDLDANYFQHVPYLEDFNEKNGTDLTWIARIHFEPMGIYSVKHSDLAVSWPKVAVPNDTSNRARALALLETNNIVPGEIVDIEAQALPSVLPDVDYAIINGNYALSAKITNKCLVTESKHDIVARTNANVIAVKKSSLNYDWVDVLKRNMTAQRVKDFISDNYGSAVIAVF